MRIHCSLKNNLLHLKSINTISIHIEWQSKFWTSNKLLFDQALYFLHFNLKVCSQPNIPVTDNGLFQNNVGQVHYINSAEEGLRLGLLWTHSDVCLLKVFRLFGYFPTPLKWQKENTISTLLATSVVVSDTNRVTRTRQWPTEMIFLHGEFYASHWTLMNFPCIHWRQFVNAYMCTFAIINHLSTKRHSSVKRIRNSSLQVIL